MLKILINFTRGTVKMNKILSHGLIFVAGAAIGGLTTFLVCKKAFSLAFQQKSEELEQYYLDLLGYSEESDPDELSNENEDKTESPEEPYTHDEGIVYPVYTREMTKRKEAFKNNPNRIRYDKIPDQLRNDTEPDVDEEKMRINNDNPDLDILIIDRDMYDHEKRSFEKLTLLWWPQNDVMTTEDYEVIDIKESLGNDWADRFGEFERDTVYVRNMVTETDYEIVMQHDDYFDYQ